MELPVHCPHLLTANNILLRAGRFMKRVPGTHRPYMGVGGLCPVMALPCAPN